jgi:hypothetical protein
MDLELLPIFGLLALGMGAVVYVVVMLVRPDRAAKPPRKQLPSNGRLVLMIFLGFAVVVWVWRLFAGPAGRLDTSPVAAPLDCSDARINALAKSDPARMREEFRQCLHQLQQRMKQ